MSDISEEKKLKLIHQVRSQNHRNQSDMMTREQILYGRSIYRDSIGKDTSHYNEEISEKGIFRDNTFGIRLALAGILLITFIILDKTGKGIAGITTHRIAEVLSSDYGKAVEAWAETINNP